MGTNTYSRQRWAVDMCGVTTIDTKRNGQWQYICDQETRQNTTLIMHMHIEPEARSERKFDYSC